MARPKKLRAKKQAAQAAAAVAAERERSTLYNELDDRWLASMGWEDYGSEGFSRPPPELFGFNQVRDAVFGDAEYACCGGESSDNSDDNSSDDDDEAEAEAAVCSQGVSALACNTCVNKASLSSSPLECPCVRTSCVPCWNRVCRPRSTGFYVI